MRQRLRHCTCFCRCDCAVPSAAELSHVRTQCRRAARRHVARPAQAAPAVAAAREPLDGTPHPILVAACAQKHAK
eukprot:6202921-Pleurochrysis_carterae.AAC.8